MYKYKFDATITIIHDYPNCDEAKLQLRNMGSAIFEDILNSLNLEHRYDYTCRLQGDETCVELLIHVCKEVSKLQHVVYLTQILQGLCNLYDYSDDIACYFRLH